MALIGIDAFDLRPRGKGVSRVLQNIVPHFLRSSSPFCYLIITTDEGKQMLHPSLRDAVARAPMMLGSAWEQFALPLLAKRNGVDLLYLHRESAPLWGPPYVLHVPEDPEIRWQRTPPTTHRDRLRRLYTRAVFPMALSRARHIVTSSKATAESLARFPQLDASRNSVVWLGVDKQFLEGESRDGRPPYIFHLGSSDPRDNSLLVVNAYRELRRLNVEAPPLVIAGDLGVLTQQVQLEVHRLGLSEHVRLLGRVRDNELVHLYSEANVTVQPSSDEGFGLQPLEAIACGSPLVACDTSAVRETMGGHARLVPSLDAEDFAIAIEDVLSSDSEAARASRRLHARRFGWENTAARLEGIFRKVLLDAN